MKIGLVGFERVLHNYLKYYDTSILEDDEVIDL